MSGAPAHTVVPAGGSPAAPGAPAQAVEPGAPALLDYTVLHTGAPDPTAVGGGLWVGEKYGLRELWAKYGRGGGARVAVIDTGCDAAHPSLRRCVEACHDYTPDPRARLGGGDRDGHGTHVCGIVAGEPFRDAPVGVAPDCRVHSFRVFGDGGECSSARLCEALADICSGRFGFFDVVNMSLGAPEPDERQRLLLLRLSAMGTLIVCAAGNSDSHSRPGAPRFGTLSYPAAFNSTVAVGSTDSREARSAYSSTGPKLTLLAPGQDVASTWPGGGFAVLSGTSMAAPFLSGVLAVLCGWCRREARRDLSLDRLMYCFASTSFDVEQPGFDMSSGYGVLRPLPLLNAFAALPPREQPHA